MSRKLWGRLHERADGNYKAVRIGALSNSDASWNWRVTDIFVGEDTAPTIPQAAEVPGFVLVPREATREMLPEAWRIANGKPGLGVDHECLRAIYRSMLAAAPTPTASAAKAEGEAAKLPLCSYKCEAFPECGCATDRTREGGDDTRRLDWIERKVCNVVRWGQGQLRIDWNNGADSVTVGKGGYATWREAIDAVSGTTTSEGAKP